MNAISIYNRYYWMYSTFYAQMVNNEDYSKMQKRIKDFTIHALMSADCNILLIKKAVSHELRNLYF